MAISLKDFLSSLSTTNTQIVLKNLELENICKFYADGISSLEDNLSARTVYRWDIIRNNLLNIYLNDEEKTETISVDGVSLNVETIALNVGSQQSLEVTISPSDATNQNVTWLSSDENIATVVDGVVTGVAEGVATIVVTTEDGGHSATCVANVSVEEEVISVTNISLSETNLELEIGSEPVQLIATIEPDNATDKTVSWGSGDETIATVVDGLVTPIAQGSTTISAITNDGGFIATCNVVVSVPVINVESVELNESAINIVLGNTDFPTLIATVLPEGATYDEIVWTSSDESVVTVSNGELTPIAEGTANIIASVNDIESTPCVVTITSE